VVSFSSSKYNAILTRKKIIIDRHQERLYVQCTLFEDSNAKGWFDFNKIILSRTIIDRMKDDIGKAVQREDGENKRKEYFMKVMLGVKALILLEECIVYQLDFDSAMRLCKTMDEAYFLGRLYGLIDIPTTAFKYIPDYILKEFERFKLVLKGGEAKTAKSTKSKDLKGQSKGNHEKLFDKYMSKYEGEIKKLEKQFMELFDLTNTDVTCSSIPLFAIRCMASSYLEAVLKMKFVTTESRRTLRWAELPGRRMFRIRDSDDQEETLFMWNVMVAVKRVLFETMCAISVKPTTSPYLVMYKRMRRYRELLYDRHTSIYGSNSNVLNKLNVNRKGEGVSTIADVLKMGEKLLGEPKLRYMVASIFSGETQEILSVGESVDLRESIRAREWTMMNFVERVLEMEYSSRIISDQDAMAVRALLA